VLIEEKRVSGGAAVHFVACLSRQRRQLFKSLDARELAGCLGVSRPWGTIFFTYFILHFINFVFLIYIFYQYIYA
jgi:hypothetical protein